MIESRTLRAAVSVDIVSLSSDEVLPTRFSTGPGFCPDAASRLLTFGHRWPIAGLLLATLKEHAASDPVQTMSHPQGNPPGSKVPKRCEPSEPANRSFWTPAKCLQPFFGECCVPMFEGTRQSAAGPTMRVESWLFRFCFSFLKCRRLPCLPSVSDSNRRQPYSFNTNSRLL